MNKKGNRARKAGRALAKALLEMVNLMYQENTAANFLAGVDYTLERSSLNKKRDRTKTPIFCFGCESLPKRQTKYCKIGRDINRNVKSCVWKRGE